MDPPAPEPSSGEVRLPTILLDVQEARQAKRHRSRRFWLQQVPGLRVLGGALLLVAAWAHNVFILREFDPRSYGLLVLVVLGYSILSWAVSIGLRRIVEPRLLGELFLSLDVAVWTLVIYATGGERSLLFVVLLVRVADQVASTFRRTLYFACLSTLAYAGLLVYLVTVEGRAIYWPAETGKLAILGILGLYISLTARTAEALRRRTTSAIRLAQRFIRELEQQSRQLDDARARAEAANRAKTRFLATMSHELRTPLNAVIGFSSVLLEQSDQRAGPRLQLERIHANGLHLLELINQVLDLSKVEAGREDVAWDWIDLPQLLAETCAASTPSDDPGTVELRVSVPDGTRPLRTDAAKLRQILFNLIGNALKFTVTGSVTVAVLIDDHGEAEAIEVRDTGIGIATEHLARIFEPFEQADGDTSRHYSGTGLGLAISRSLADLLGYRLAVASEVGRGSCFLLELRPGALVASGREPT